AYAFAIFAIIAVIQLFFAWKIMPETKGKSLEQIQTLIIH
ncbi:MAG TPA: MFS transporter, partial [Cyclobacteriaceae bacterium]